ncbi:hypothetical protein F5I97DRAFT_1862201 [Phlebopus sp. FC_14]|nr:hypothetical protein F5I97DRAFT_1862201 [Phlebopus sp. FC_14]
MVSSILKTLLVHGSAEPSVNEFLDHPDFRQIAAFFLGWLFICSVSSAALSPAIRDIVRWFRLCVAHSSLGYLDVAGVRALPVFSIKRRRGPSYFDTSSSSSHPPRDEHEFLVLLLFLCFTFASVANFSSLLTFSGGNGGTSCAFVIALGGISATCARLLGLVTLSYELRELGVTKFELYTTWLWIFIAIAFAFADYAISVGVTEPVPQLGTFLCYRVRYLPTSLTTSLVYVSLELYVLFRLLSLVAPTFLSLRHRVDAIRDTRVLRVLSLICMELLVIVPSAVFIGLVGEFVPFTFGALLVIAAFNKRLVYQTPPDNISSLPPLSISGPMSPDTRTWKSQNLSIHTCSTAPLSSPYTSTAGPLALQTRPPSGPTRSSMTSSLETVMRHSSSMLKPVGQSIRRDHQNIVPPTMSPPLSPHTGIYYHQDSRDACTVNRPFRKPISSHQDEKEGELRRCRGLPIPPRLTVAIPIEPRVFPQPDLRLRSANSAVYGSDVIHVSTGGEAASHHSSLNDTVKSGQTWISLWRASSVDSLQWRSLERAERWLTFGDCSSSPTRRKTFTDRSLEPVRHVASPTEMSDAHFRSSRVVHMSTLGEHNGCDHPRRHRGSRSSASRTREKVVKASEPVRATTDAAPGMIRARIRGPRPLPRVFSPTAIGE